LSSFSPLQHLFCAEIDFLFSLYSSPKDYISIALRVRVENNNDRRIITGVASSGARFEADRKALTPPPTAVCAQEHARGAESLRRN
jgi:hypothetical protein